MKYGIRFDEEPLHCPKCEGEVTHQGNENSPGEEYKKFRCDDCGFTYTEAWKFQSWKVECEDCDDEECRNNPEKECDQTDKEPAQYCPHCTNAVLKELKEPTPTGHTHQCPECATLHAPYGFAE